MLRGDAAAASAPLRVTHGLEAGDDGAGCCSHPIVVYYLQLIYKSFASYLVEHKGYDPDLLNLTPSTWDFW
ncbi:hypothetical protein NHX12_026664 [Muraenolepis orangiensis]|uniref:Uncharacterized protein n=1 Tax=Muraenolepis orangiensis TaxID=630683 RepID=A0A9Q0IR06_9TELE|nr:hypothetical protein NHX12_026664 [Muraenolepis orangiensis]